MVVDQVTDVSATFGEVCNNELGRESFLVVGRTFPWQESSIPVISVSYGVLRLKVLGL